MADSPCRNCKHRVVNEVMEYCDRKLAMQIWCERLGDLRPSKRCWMQAGKAWRASMADEKGLLPCPYSKATRCLMDESCEGCEKRPEVR
jgi:hypothetical protein